MATEGWHGWDEYAPFYDWENARTFGRRDVRFWIDQASRLGGPVLELGCGTGRLSLPVARVVERFVGIDRSASMLTRLRKRLRRGRLGGRATLVRCDIRALPFRKRWRFQLVMAPYGMLQSLLRNSDLTATLGAVSQVLGKAGTFVIDLVPDLPRWDEYTRRISLRGRTTGGRNLTLIESVRQDRQRRLTIFEQEFVEQRGRQQTPHRFSLVFRTLTLRQIMNRLDQAGFRIEAVFGDYRGHEWCPEADAWVILARRR